MKGKNNNIQETWNKFPDIFSQRTLDSEFIDIEKLFSELFIIGDFFYYALNFATGNISQIHPNISNILGLSTDTKNIQELFNFFHPDDLDYIILAQNACCQKIAELKKPNTINYKISFCLRMKTIDGNYQMFHHQAIPLSLDEHGTMITVLNIFSNINHISPQHNYIAYATNLEDPMDLIQINLADEIKKTSKNKSPLSSREQEILQFISKGLSSTGIAKELGISDQTVRVHRKNILKKTASYNSSSLIKKCIEMGWL